jgi:uncharacterized protein YecE (DUF72 family)
MASSQAMQTWIGTAGFRYEYWKGVFFPQRISKARMLPFYAEHFNATELDYGFQIPKTKVIRDWCAVTPERFRFAFEVQFRIRPTRKFRGCRELLEAYQEALSAAGRKGGPVRVRVVCYRNMDALRAFLEAVPPGMRCAFEFQEEKWFREKTWFTDEVFETLRGANAVLCLGDGPSQFTRLRKVHVATADFGYVRWYGKGYTSAQLKEWARWIGEQRSRWKEAYVFFESDAKARSVRLAERLREIVEGSASRVGGTEWGLPLGDSGAP